MLCDTLRLYTNYEGLGAEAFFDPRMWRWEDWVTLSMTYGPAAMRVAFCLCIGVEEKSKIKGA